MRRDSSRYGNFPKRQKSRERPWNRASPAFGKLWEHAGKCRVDLSNIENGYTIPSLETFTELSVTLGKTPDFFLLGHIREDIVGNIEDSLKLCSKERLNLIYKIVELLKD